jgi:hypothetical protein
LIKEALRAFLQPKTKLILFLRNRLQQFQIYVFIIAALTIALFEKHTKMVDVAEKIKAYQTGKR